MAQTTHGSVRIGPISIFTLVIVLCLVVLSVLAFSAAQAQDRITERQAATTASTYALEVAGQTFMAEVDGYLSGTTFTNSLATDVEISAEVAARAGFSALEEQEDNQEDEAITSITGEAALKGNTIEATFIASNGRTLTIALDVLKQGADASSVGAAQTSAFSHVTVAKWEITTQWEEDTSTSNIWDGSVEKAE